MAKLKNYISTMNSRDKELYKMLLNTCHANRDQLKNFISEARVKNYMKQGILEEIKNSRGTYYKLNEKGYKFMAKEFGQENCKYHSTSAYHDEKLSAQYCKVYLESQTNNSSFQWKNEQDLKQEYKHTILELRTHIEREYWDRAEKLELGSTVDSVIITESSTYAFEIITENYGKLEQEKDVYAEGLNVTLVKEYTYK